MFTIAEGGPMSPPAVLPLIKKSKKTSASAEMRKIPEESPSASADATCEPDLSNTVQKEEVHTTICSMLSASVGMSTPSPHADADN